MKGKLTLLLAALVLLTGGGAIAQNTVTLFDDGDPIYNDGVYDLEGVGRPAEAATPSGYTYDGQRYLTIWGDTARDTCRLDSRVSAFIRGDVGLDTSQDYYIRWEIANDFVMPDFSLMLFMVPTKPDASTLNTGAAIRDNMGWWIGCGDQLPGDDERAGIWMAYYDTSNNFASLDLSPRLDPDPDETMLRGGVNIIAVQWTASTQTYHWWYANVNGMREGSVAQIEMGKPLPPTMYWAAGTVDNKVWMGSGWTIWEVDYGQGIMTPPGPIEPQLVGDLADLRGIREGTLVKLEGRVVTRQFSSPTGVPAGFAVEELARNAGVRVAYTHEAFYPGDKVNVVGGVGVTRTGEVFISARPGDVQYLEMSDRIPPVLMQSKSLAGEPITQGLYNQGLLAKITGTVTYVEGNSESFWVDDGAGLDAGSGHLGVRVWSPLDWTGYITPQVGSVVATTGVIGSYTEVWSVTPRCYTLAVNEVGHLNVRMGHESYSLGLNGLTSQAIVPLNTWTHVALVSNGTTVRWWVNGQADSRTLSMTPVVVGPIPLMIGIYEKDRVQGGFNGLIDEVRISRVARSFAGAPAAPYTSDADTVVLYHFDEGTGNVTANAAGDPALDGALGDSTRPTWTAGKFGGALDFSGGGEPNDCWVMVPDNPALALEDGVFTIEAWVYPRSYEQAHFLTKYTAGTITKYLWDAPMLRTGLAEDLQELQPAPQ